MCMPVCPTGAIQLINFRDDQLLDEIIAVSGGGAVCEWVNVKPLTHW